MEEGDVHVLSGGSPRDSSLCVVQPPTRREVATVFGTVRIADHHHLSVPLSGEVGRVGGLGEDRRECCVGTLEVTDLFKQRHDSQR